ncbi:MAG: phosphonate C-P lyase system protein PhnH [Pseudomonadota bacterium]
MLAAGFAEPSREGAVAFRALLDAMARPGTIATLRVETPPAGLSPAAAAVLLTLADPDTPVLLGADAQPAADWLVFHAGAPATTDRAAATLAVGNWDEMLPLDAWAEGTPDYPDQSATLVVAVEALEGGPVLTLTGPGIPGTRTFAPMLPAGAAEALAANARRFPLGVDIVLTAGDRVAALPRSTRLA